MGPYAVVDFISVLCPLQKRLQHIYHGQPYARVNLNTARVDFIPQSGTFELGLWSQAQALGN
jgi:hypothetical protein